MNPSASSIEAVFARALEMPAGAGRDHFVAAQCVQNPALLREVASLLQAHDEAGDFLHAPTASPNPDHQNISPSAAGTTSLNAAAQAKTFLRYAAIGSGETAGGQMDEYLAALPEAVRAEARERIEAALRVRRLQAPLEAASPAEELPPALPGFRIESKLGEGSLGVVYSAHDEKLNRRVALKVLRARADEPLRRRLLDEARKAAALNDPAIVTIFSVLDEANTPAIVMELVEGFPLDRFAAQLTVEQKARLLREVARGLATAHERGLVHRDLKPDNIIVGPDLRPRILDFGLALSLEEASRLPGGFEGTPLYASPEQVQGRPLTPASDIFSLGSLMFKVLTGRPPFIGDSAAQVFEGIATTAPPFLREVAAGVPEDLQAVCLACLAWNPADRPAATEIALELGRFLVGEPVRLKPKLYDDLLRRSISEYSTQARAWESQNIISQDEHDALEIVHRRLLADEDHWIIEARRITPLQTVLSGATWLAVVATILTVWMLRNDLGPIWRWVLPLYFTLTLLLAGNIARRQRELSAAATFLAGAVMCVAPCLLALLAGFHVWSVPGAGVDQLFAKTFTNQQVLAASFAALMVSGFSLQRLKLTGFAWTTAVLVAASYLSLLLCFNWLDQKPEIQALWCLPLITMETAAWMLERKGRVRWTMPFHLVALLTLVAGLDLIALNGPTLKMLGVDDGHWPYFDHQRQVVFSIVLNGLLFLGLMLWTERAPSLDWRRASKFLEMLAIVHILSALFVNALDHRNDPHVGVDVWLYLGAAGLFTVLAPFRSRWRLLVGGLAGCGLGSYLLVDLGIVNRDTFVVSLGFAGLLLALGSYAYVRRRSQSGRKPR